MYSVTDVDQDMVNAVLDEFLGIIKQQTGLGLGAGNYIKNVLTKALGDDKAQSVLRGSHQHLLNDQLKFWIGWMRALSRTYR